MYNLLSQLLTESDVRLTDTQQGLLVSIYAAPTAELAFEATTGDENITSAKEFLARHGLIEINSTQARVTSSGSDVLEQNGLIDATGEITEDGKAQVDGLQQRRQAFQESLIPFRMLKSFN